MKNTATSSELYSLPLESCFPLQLPRPFILRPRPRPATSVKAAILRLTLTIPLSAVTVLTSNAPGLSILLTKRAAE
jgi:hypothetical protein